MSPQRPLTLRPAAHPPVTEERVLTALAAGRVVRAEAAGARLTALPSPAGVCLGYAGLGSDDDGQPRVLRWTVEPPIAGPDGLFPWASTDAARMLVGFVTDPAAAFRRLAPLLDPVS